jgi:hypothetical protein
LLPSLDGVDHNGINHNGTDRTRDTQQFFTRYAKALLDRDHDTIADLYAVPGLIAFPDQRVAVTDREQTRQMFAQNWSAYDGVTEAIPEVVVVQTAHSVWADVTWSYGGGPRERYVYQLLRGPAGWQIGVLTPLELSPREP